MKPKIPPLQSGGSINFSPTPSDPRVSSKASKISGATTSSSLNYSSIYASTLSKVIGSPFSQKNSQYEAQHKHKEIVSEYVNPKPEDLDQSLHIWKWNDEKTKLTDFSLTALRGDLVFRLKYDDQPLYTLEECKVLLKETVQLIQLQSEEDIKSLIYLSRLRTQLLFPKPIVKNYILGKPPTVPSFSSVMNASSSRPASPAPGSAPQQNFQTKQPTISTEEEEQRMQQAAKKIAGFAKQKEDYAMIAKILEQKMEKAFKPPKTFSPSNEPEDDDDDDAEETAKKELNSLLKQADSESSENGTTSIASQNENNQNTLPENEGNTNAGNDESRTEGEISGVSDDTLDEIVKQRAKFAMKHPKVALVRVIRKINFSLLKMVDSYLRQRKERLLLAATILEEIEEVEAIQKVFKILKFKNEVFFFFSNFLFFLNLFLNNFSIFSSPMF